MLATGAMLLNAQSISNGKAVLEWKVCVMELRQSSKEKIIRNRSEDSPGKLQSGEKSCFRVFSPSIRLFFDFCLHICRTAGEIELYFGAYRLYFRKMEVV